MVEIPNNEPIYKKILWQKQTNETNKCIILAEFSVKTNLSSFLDSLMSFLRVLERW